MMMISNRSSAAVSRARRGRIVALSAAVVLVGAAALWRAPLTQLFWSAAAPLLQARYGTESAAADLLAAADRDALYQENLELKSRLGRPGATPVRILGAVLMRPPATPYDTLVIDAGASEGVAEGDYVSAGGTMLVGTVSEAYTHAARVKLFSAPGEQYDGVLQLSGPLGGALPLTVEGQGGGSMRAQVPAGTAVFSGDTVLIPGIMGGFAARVSHAEQPEGSFVTIYLQLPADPFALRFVEVWKQQPHDQN
jgi:cell shape-determining protein MreC